MAAFVMLSCLSIGTMSVAAVAATRAVFKPAESPSVNASGAVAPGGPGSETLVASKSGPTAKKGVTGPQRSTGGEKRGENE